MEKRPTMTLITRSKDNGTIAIAAESAARVNDLETHAHGI
jgi:hypothetical protein